MSNRKQRTRPPGNDRIELFARAQALARAGRWVDAIDIWRGIILLDDRDPRARSNLGLSLAYAGRWVEAVDAFGEALRLGLAEDEVLAGLGIVFCLREQYDVARQSLEKAVALNPKNLSAWSNLVVAYARLGLVERAVQAANQVLAVRPDDAVTLSALGTMCIDAAMPDEAIAWFRRAIEKAPAKIQDVSNLLWAMLHADSVTPGQLVSEARSFNSRVCASVGVAPPPRRKLTGSVPDKVRIGWVSADLRAHPVGYFVVPVLEQLDRNRFESIVYHNSHVQDEMSQRARNVASTWREIAGLGDEQVAEFIRADNVHILMDLSGHTAGNRLPVFARAVAPIHATWLGYPGTTGLAAMDFIVVPPDPVLALGAWCTETPLALPDCYCARDRAQIPLVTASGHPHERNGFITFGCLNNFTKVSPSAIGAWARILSAIPDARLVLVATGGNDQHLVADIKNRFLLRGVQSDRLCIHGRMSRETYFETYCSIDITLDPFPFNGGTTALDSLCMGTPFITLLGQALHSRMGGNLLRVIGLPELVATSQDEYVVKAVSLAKDWDALKQIRGSLRNKVDASPLADVPAFARAIERLFLEMWKRKKDPANRFGPTRIH